MPNLHPTEDMFQFSYEACVPASESAGGDVSLWIPIASTDDHQTVGRIGVEAPFPHRETRADGNRMIHLLVPRGSPETRGRAAYEVRRRSRRVEIDLDAAYGSPLDGQNLKPDAHVPIDGFIAEQALSAVRELDPPGRKARGLFDHLMSSFAYDARGCTPERANELGNLALACDVKRGTCTEFHGLLVGCARAVGIPARFCFGFNVPASGGGGSIGGYHCWAELFLPAAGWAPIDVTEALKARMAGREEDVDFFFGGITSNRLEVSRGRDVRLDPPLPQGRVDKLIFAVAARGAELFQPGLAFSYQRS